MFVIKTYTGRYLTESHGRLCISTTDDINYAKAFNTLKAAKCCIAARPISLWRAKIIGINRKTVETEQI